jgi:acetyl esterase
MLWPEEYEGLRDEARSMAATIAELYGVEAMAGDTTAADPAARLAAQRAGLAALEQESPAGRDEMIAGVPCRVFDAGTTSGTYLHFHGGAMIMGSSRMNDVANAALAEDLGVRVVSVDYRLAPEHPFPAGSDDCIAVARAELDRTDGPIVLGGESAGGYYAALATLRIRDELGAIDRIAGANLVFGVFDLSGTPSNIQSRPSDVPDILDGRGMASLVEAYLPGRTVLEARDPACSPLYADLTGLPPALFTVGHADHLLDDSLFMAARWLAFGNEAELAVYPDCIHGFTDFPMELAKRANLRIDGFLRRCFRRVDENLPAD